MKIFTYYDDSVGLDGPDDRQTPIFELWEKSWRARGWEPIRLVPRDARQHPLYNAVTEHVTPLPRLGNPIKYELACYHRWLALDLAGGGYTSDYDVLNYSLAPLPPRELDFEVFANGHGCPCFVYASKKGLAWFIQATLGYKSGQSVSGTYQDQDLVCFLKDQKKHDMGSTVLCYQNNDHKYDSPVVHFSHASCRGDRLKAIAEYPRKLNI